MTPAPSSDPFDPWGLAPDGPAPGPISLIPAGKPLAGGDHCSVCELVSGMVAVSSVQPVGLELTPEWRDRVLRVEHRGDRVRVLWGDLCTLDLSVDQIHAWALEEAPPGRLATLRAFLGVQRQAARGAVLGLRRGFWGLVLAGGEALAGLGVRRLAALSRHQKE